MRFVHVEDFIHPEAGYQVNMLSKLQVEQGHEVFIVTAEMDRIPDYLTVFFGKENIKEKDDAFYQKTGAKIIRVPIRVYYSGRAVFYSDVFNVVKDLKPDVALIHGEDTLTGMQFIWKAKQLSFPLVLDCHMLEMASKNRLARQFRWFFRNFVTPYILKYNIPLLRVTDSDFVQKYYGIPLNKTELCPLGTDVRYFQPDSESRKLFRQRYQIGEDDFVILYAGKLDSGKGGKLLAAAIKERFRTNKTITILVIGNSVGNYGQEVDEVFAQSENRILRFPTQTYMNLQPFYQAADLALFAKQCSMSFMEMQACGLPVCFEKNEINSLRAKYNNAITFEPGDVSDFRSKIEKIINLPQDEFQAMKEGARQYICDNFDFTLIADKISSIMINQAVKYKNNLENAKTSSNINRG